MSDLRTKFILGRDEISEERLQAVDISMLDYDYVDQCNDIPQLKDILQILSLGREGKYPHLEETVVNRILSLLPEKDRKRILSMSVILSSSEKEHHKADLVAWVERMTYSQDSSDNTAKDGNLNKDIFLSEEYNNENKPKSKHDTERYPPIRRQKKSTVPNISTSSSCKKARDKEDKKLAMDNKTSEFKQISKENLSNRDYFRAWDKFDFDAAERMIDNVDDRDKDDNNGNVLEDHDSSIQRLQIEQKWQQSLDKQTSRSILQLDKIRKLINFSELSETERKFMASREKDKGNEYFRNKEYEQSYTCYTKSLALNDQNAVVYANRAMVNIRLSNLNEAVSDCTQAVSIDPLYTKAFARRGMVHHKCGRYLEARMDFAICINHDPDNKEYALLLKKSTEKFDEVNGEEKHEKTKTRVVIMEDDESDGEETDNDSDIEEVFTPCSLNQ